MATVIWNIIRITWLLIWIVPCWAAFLLYSLIMLIAVGPEEVKLFWDRVL
jgi:hypothetical protein